MATIAKDMKRTTPSETKITLLDMINRRDELTSESGHYYGVTELSLRDSDPIKYERFYSKIHASVLAARESARYVAASPGSREMGEVLWGLATPEGDTLAVSAGFLSFSVLTGTLLSWFCKAPSWEIFLSLIGYLIK